MRSEVQHAQFNARLPQT